MLRYMIKHIESCVVEEARVLGLNTYPKPWWAPIFGLGKVRYFAFFGKVYVHELSAFQPKALLAHEGYHLLRQRQVGQWNWLANYVFSPKFRLQEECKAIALEIELTANPEEQSELFRKYVSALSTKEYWYAAESWVEASAELMKYLQIVEV